jgi:hypothetical protein
MDVALQGSCFAEKFTYTNNEGRNDMCYVAFKVVD